MNAWDQHERFLRRMDWLAAVGFLMWASGLLYG